MKWIGLTGGIASGKSQVGQILKSLGVQVADADFWARKALDVGQAPYQQLVEHWGATYLGPDQTIDRYRLGQFIFAHPDKKKQLESWVHPFVQKQVQNQRQDWVDRGESWAVYDIPLLFESHQQELFDRVVVVFCSRELQIERLRQRNRLSLSEAELRLSAQWPLTEKARLADDIIDNQGSLGDLKKAVERWKQSIDSRYTESTN